MFNYIKSATAEDEVIIFRKPRVLALMTSRRSTPSHKAKNDQELWSFFADIRASYIIEDISAYIIDDIWDHEQAFYLASFISRNKNRLLCVFSNSKYKVYKII
jgi:hypothetical protein